MSVINKGKQGSEGSQPANVIIKGRLSVKMHLAFARIVAVSCGNRLAPVLVTQTHTGGLSTTQSMLQGTGERPSWGIAFFPSGSLVIPSPGGTLYTEHLEGSATQN